MFSNTQVISAHDVSEEAPSAGTRLNQAGQQLIATNVSCWRFLSCALSVVCFVLMITAFPDITKDEFRPYETDAFHVDSCMYHFEPSFGEGGSFNLQPYQFVIAMAAVFAVYNLFLMGYNMLPTTATDSSGVDKMSIQCSVWSYCFNKTTLLLLDTLVLLFGLSACILSLWIVQLPEGFPYYKNLDGSMEQRQYYTMTSYYKTFSKTSPACIDMSGDPSPMVQASTAMMYLAVLCMFMVWQLTVVVSKTHGISAQLIEPKGQFDISGGDKLRSLVHGEVRYGASSQV